MASGQPHQALWPQVKAHFELTRIDDLPIDWIPDALAFVQSKIDALAIPVGKARAALPVVTSPVFPPAVTGEHELLHRLRARRVEFSQVAWEITRKLRNPFCGAQAGSGGLILLGPDNHCREYAEAFEPDQYFMDILLSRTERPAA